MTCMGVLNYGCNVVGEQKLLIIFAVKNEIETMLRMLAGN